jgi:hypothetical protein
MSNRMSRSVKREPFTHINLYITKRTFEYFDKQPNMSAAIRDVLDQYVGTQLEEQAEIPDSDNYHQTRPV